jgi:hypothetical protein
LLVVAAVGASLAACGSGTKTVSVGSSAASAQTTTSAQHTTSTSSTASAPAKTTPAPRTSAAPTTTRTAPEPEFAQQERKVEGLSTAAAVLRSHGYTPANPSDYHPNQALRVLIGVRTGSGDGYTQQAFFFVNQRYLGTDAIAPSAALRVVGQNDTEVTLAYPLYRSGDPLCCPGGGHTRVRFQLNNGKLTPLEPIPPASSKKGFSRQ